MHIVQRHADAFGSSPNTVDAARSPFSMILADRGAITLVDFAEAALAEAFARAGLRAAKGEEGTVEVTVLLNGEIASDLFAVSG
jgi:hypothetical protein